MYGARSLGGRAEQGRVLTRSVGRETDLLRAASDRYSAPDRGNFSFRVRIASAFTICATSQMRGRFAPRSRRALDWSSLAAVSSVSRWRRAQRGSTRMSRWWRRRSTSWGRVVPVELGRAVEDLHTSCGVRFALGQRPAEVVVAGGRVTGVGLEDGTALEADLVVVGIGVEPRTEFAEAAGLCVENGILVDDRFRTPDDDRIFAAGDVARIARGGNRLRTEQWRPAEEQGRAVAASLLGQGIPYGAVPWMWSDQFDLHLQATGYGFDGSEIVERGSLAERTGVIYLGLRDHRVVAACGLSRGTGISPGDPSRPGPDRARGARGPRRAGNRGPTASTRQRRWPPPAAVNVEAPRIASPESSPWLELPAEAAARPVGRGMQDKDEATRPAPLTDGPHRQDRPNKQKPRRSGVSRSMRLNGVEPSRVFPPTRPSTLRVYQFRHSREVGRRSRDSVTFGAHALPAACERPPEGVLCEQVFV